MPDRVDRSDPGARHGGNLQGLIDKLDYIAAMGYTAIWPTPLTESREPRFSYHGYAASDTYRVDPRYGSLSDYRRLADEARKRGLCLIQDVVPNHISAHHWWMKDLPAPDWLGYEGQPVLTSHARTTVSDPYAATVDRQRFTSGWFDASMPDMNQRNPQLAIYQIQNAIWWIEEIGLCGLRVDTYGYSDAALINEWTRRILQEYPRLNIVGEEWSDNPAVQAYWMRGRTQADGFVSHLPSVMDFVLQGALRQALVEPDSVSTGLGRLHAALVNDQLYPDAGNLMLFDGNHDTPRLYSALNQDPALVRMALAYVLTMKRVPQLYYGTEILMESPKRQDAFDAFRADFPGGFAGDAVDAVSGRGLRPEQVELQAWLRRLLNWRKTQAVIHHGALTHFVPEDGCYVLFRHQDSHVVMVAFNKAAEARVLQTGRFREVLPAHAQGVDIMSGESLDLSTRLRLPPRSVLIVQIEARRNRAMSL
jgi:glycosidase